jgi:large subunit ribosomal protein L15
MSLTLHTLKPARGSRTRRFRVGRGNASGSGTTAGRGTKGQRARTGGRNKLKLKGMKQMLLRIPKNRGFKSGIPRPHAVTFEQLDRWMKNGERVVLADLQKRHLVPANAPSVKVVNTGKLTKKLVFVDVRTTAEAKKIIEQAGGSFETTAKKKGKKTAPAASKKTSKKSSKKN